MSDFLVKLSEEQKKQVKQGASIIDRVVNEIVLPYSTMSNNMVILSFAKIFAHKEDDLVSHYLDKFIANNDKDFGRYYLSCDLGMIRSIFNHFDIPMEADKITDERELIMAQLDGKNKFDIYPFEYEIVRRFFLYANNHSIDSLSKRAEFIDIDKKLNDEKLSRYGNGINWAKAWIHFDQLSKESFVELLICDLK